MTGRLRRFGVPYRGQIDWRADNLMLRKLRLRLDASGQTLSCFRKQWPDKRPFIPDEAARFFCKGYRLLNVRISDSVLAVLVVSCEARKPNIARATSLFPSHGRK